MKPHQESFNELVINRIPMVAICDHPKMQSDILKKQKQTVWTCINLCSVMKELQQRGKQQKETHWLSFVTVESIHGLLSGSNKTSQLQDVQPTIEDK